MLPVLLIAVGVLLLLNTLGVLPWSFWQAIWRFWPLVLVLIGVELMLGRGNPWLSALLALLVVGVVVAFAFFAAVVPWTWSRGGPAAVVMQQEVQVPLEGAREATVTMRFGAGRLDVAALSADSANLLEGSLQHQRGEEGVRVSTERQGDRAAVVVEARDGAVFVVPGGSDEHWQLRLNPSLPLDLRFEGGAAEVDLDLRALRVRSLHVETGASSARIVLPEAAGRTVATIKAGMAQLRVDVPEGVAVRIDTGSGLSSVQVDERRFPRQGNTYVSPDYDTASNRVEISIDAGMASVTVR